MELTARQWRAMLSILTGLLLLGAVQFFRTAFVDESPEKTERVAEAWGFETSTAP